MAKEPYEEIRVQKAGLLPAVWCLVLLLWLVVRVLNYRLPLLPWGDDSIISVLRFFHLHVAQALLLIFISFLLFIPPSIEKKMSIVTIWLLSILASFSLSSEVAVINKGLFSSLTTSVESTHQLRVPPAFQDQAHHRGCKEGKVLVSCCHHLIPQNAPLKMHWAFFPFSNHMLSVCLTSLARSFSPGRKFIWCRLPFPPNISFSIATRIRTNCPSNLSQILTATHHWKLSDGKTEKSNNQATSGLVFTFSLWCLSFQGGEFIRVLCSCSPAVTKPRLSSAKASRAVNKAVLVNRI